MKPGKFFSNRFHWNQRHAIPELSALRIESFLWLCSLKAQVVAVKFLKHICIYMYVLSSVMILYMQCNDLPH